MKYLQDYMTERQTAAFKKYGAFFAFSESQLREGMEEHGHADRSKLCDAGGGMICPTENVKALTKTLETIYRESIEQDVKENGIEQVVLRELGNHEAYYTCSIASTVEALADYPVTPRQIKTLFHNKNAKL